MVNARSFPSCGELEKHVKDVMTKALDPLPRPFTWAMVEKALDIDDIIEWWSNPTFEDEEYDSSEIGDFIIRARGYGAIAGYHTGPGGVDEDARKPRYQVEAP